MNDHADMERAVVSACLCDPTQLATVGGAITGEDFTDRDLGVMLDTLTLLHDSGQPVTDPKLLTASLKARGMSPAAATVRQIAKLIGEGIPHNAKYYAAKIQQAATVRRQKLALSQAQMMLDAQDADAAEVSAWLEPQMAAALDRHTTGTRHISEVARAVVADLRSSRNRSDTGIFTGLYSFDKTFGRMKAGELIVIAARTNVGKTAFASQVAVTNAMVGNHTWFASYEMSPEELTQRVLCARSKVNSQRVRAGQVDDDELSALEAATQDMADCCLGIWKRPFATLRQLRAEAKLVNGRHKLSAAVIDYMQLVEPDDRRRQRHEQVSQISGGLKQLAGELSCPVLAIAQLNREADKATPTLANLRESGAIEQDADMVIFLHHDTPPALTIKPYSVFLIVAKNRHGPKGQLELTFEPTTTTFIDPAAPQKSADFDAFNNREF